MIEALLLTSGSIVLGAGLGSLTHRENVLLGSLRTFAIAAVVSGVAVQLLPEAAEHLGGWALLVFVASLALPSLIARALKKLWSSLVVTPRGLGRDLGYLGFLVHQLAEGLALGTYTGLPHDGHDHGELVWAVAAHTIPLTAVFIADALARRGRRSALRRTLGLVAATVIGFVGAGWVQHGVPHELHAYLSAMVAGFMVHVLLHDHGSPARRTQLASVFDVIGFVVGIGLPLIAVGQGAAHAGDGVRHEVVEAFVELVLETAPMLLLGLLLGALLQIYGSRIPGRYFNTGSDARQALRGILVGAPLPLCACGVLPIAESLRRRGAGPALVMAFLMATPELGPETLTLSVRFLGWPFAIVRLLAAVGLAFAAAVVFAKLTAPFRPSTPTPVAVPDANESMIMGEVQPGRAWSQAYGYFDELVLHTAPWTVAGLLAAAYVEATLTADSLASLSASGFDVVVVGAIALPSYVCAASATPLAAILLMKGISPGAVLVGMLLGPATNVATIGVLRRGYGVRAVTVGMIVVAVFSLIVGYAVNFAGIEPVVPERLQAEHEHGFASWLAVAVLGLVLLRQLWRSGTRPWFEILGANHTHGGHDHGHHHHGHDHHHGRDHDHHHDHGHDHAH